jgi:hypothetical protein
VGEKERNQGEKKQSGHVCTVDEKEENDYRHAAEALWRRS